MARHRDVRNLDSDDLGHQDDYGSSYGSSYCDEVSLSTSVEKEYMYRRNAGMSPKLSHFYGRSNSVGSIPEEDASGRNPLHPSDSDDDTNNLSPRAGYANILFKYNITQNQGLFFLALVMFGSSLKLTS